MQSLLQNTDLVNGTVVSVDALRRISEVFIDLALKKKDFWLFLKNYPLITTHTTRKKNRQTLMYVNMKNVCILLSFLHAVLALHKGHSASHESFSLLSVHTPPLEGEKPNLNSMPIIK